MKEGGRRERRRFKRLPESFRVEWAEVAFGSGRKKAASETKDVGAGGLLIESSEPYGIGTVLNLKISVPEWKKFRPGFLRYDWTSAPEPLVALGRVVRVEEILSGRLYEIGVAFTGMDEIEQGALGRLLDERKGSRGSR
ncbi:MAG: PilZ domain-containing protein [Nitrospirota bacterium]